MFILKRSWHRTESGHRLETSKRNVSFYRMGRSVVVFVCSPGCWYLAAPAPDKSAPDVREEEAILSRHLVTDTQTFTKISAGL